MTEERSKQVEKHDFPMLGTVDGMTIEVKQCSKQQSSRVETEYGIEIDGISTLDNAELPIRCNFEPYSNEKKVLHPADERSLLCLIVSMDVGNQKRVSSCIVTKCSTT
jgi:hypothetical protein